MMEITININCPALDRLAEALSPRVLTMDAMPVSMPRTNPPAVENLAAPVVPVSTVSIAQMPQMATAPLAPGAQMPTAPVAPPIMPAPVSEPDYTSEQLGRAAAAYMDKAPANQSKLIQLLQSMGVQAITQLATREQRAAFANGLRGLGAQV